MTDDHSMNVVQEPKVEEYETYGCPKPFSLDEALRQTRGGGRIERVAVVLETEVDEVDSDSIRWERPNEEIATIPEEDEAIAQVFNWAGTADEMSDGSGHIGSNDVGDTDKSKACIADDGHVHDVRDCSPSCINRCIRRGSSNCGTLGTEVWNSQCFAYGPGKSLWQ